MSKGILHICYDGNFVSGFIPVFEHFYPKQNHFVIFESKARAEHFNEVEGDNIYWMAPWKDEGYLQRISYICKSNDVEKIVCHGLFTYYMDVFHHLYKIKSYKTYWMFWGYELYRALGYSGKKKLCDNAYPWNPLSYVMPTRWANYRNRLLGRPDMEKELIDFVQYVDYFCFWLYEDYELLQEHYPNDIKFRYFQYGAKWKSDGEDFNYTGQFLDKTPCTIMINHQASMFGNHLTVMKKLKSLKGIDNYQIIVPLSYGLNKIRKIVLWVGKFLFRNKFYPILGLMSREKYYNYIGRFEVAIFGQLRQEAAGNISFFLANGTKIFMREDNVLYKFYKNKGFIVFSFETDLHSIEDLKGLTDKEKQHNLEISKRNEVYYEDFMPSLLDD